MERRGLDERGKKTNKKTHDEIDVFDIGVPLEFEGELVEIPHAHLGLVGPGSDDMVAVARALDPDARLGELKVLYELYGALDVFADRALALGLGRALPYEPVWQGRGRPRGDAIDRVDLDRLWVDCCDHRQNKKRGFLFRFEEI